MFTKEMFEKMAEDSKSRREEWRDEHIPGWRNMSEKDVIAMEKFLDRKMNGIPCPYCRHRAQTKAKLHNHIKTKHPGARRRG